MKTYCPISETAELIGTKARLLILWSLYKEDLSFNRLKKTCGLNSRTLSLNLKFLKENKIIYSQGEKNKNVYSLTKEGRELSPVLEHMREWGEKYNRKILVSV